MPQLIDTLFVIGSFCLQLFGIRFLVSIWLPKASFPYISIAEALKLTTELPGTPERTSDGAIDAKTVLQQFTRIVLLLWSFSATFELAGFCLLLAIYWKAVGAHFLSWITTAAFIGIGGFSGWIAFQLKNLRNQRRS